MLRHWAFLGLTEEHFEGDSRNIAEVSPIKCDFRECVLRTSDSGECVVGDSQRDDAKESVVGTADSQECVVSTSYLLQKIGEAAHFIGTGYILEKWHQPGGTFVLMSIEYRNQGAVLPCSLK